MSMMYNATAGLTSSQTALNVTSQNISNSAVPEYSRQEVVYGTSPTGTVYVSDVQRVSDDFMTSQVWESASDYGYSLSYGSQAVLLENTFTSDSTSLSPSLNEFYGSLNDAAADPADVANRQQVLNSADYLANSFNTLQSQMDAQYQQINDQLFAMVEEVNGTLTALADLNEAIAETSSQPGGVPNNLLDERDQLIQQMSELIDVEADIQDDETVNLYLPTGELLVMGGEANSLEMVPGDPDNSSFQLVLDTGTSKKPVTGVGGSVQGLLEFRDEQLEPAMRELGRLALVTVDSINSELEKGYDLNGNPGQPLFSDINADTGNRSAPYSDNQGDAVLDVTIEDTAQLEASDYRVDFIENPESGEVEYQVTRGTDGEIVASGTDMPIEFDGVSVTVTEGDFEAGDSFSVEPTKNFAGSVDMTLTDPEATGIFF